MSCDKFSEYLYIGDIDGTVTKYNMNCDFLNNKRQFTDVGKYPLRSIVVTGDGKKLFIASGQKSGTLKICRTEDFKIIRDFGPIHPNVIYHIVLSSDEKTLFTSCIDGYLKEWSLHSNKLVKNRRLVPFGGISSVCL